MAFNRLEPSDFVVSADSISSTLWSNDAPTLTTFATSSTQEISPSGQFYLSIYPTASSDEVQFNIAYGDSEGSGSLAYNYGASIVNSPTSTIYGQFQDLVLGDENTDFTFGDVTSTNFIALTFERTRYKESLLPGSLTLILDSSGNKVSLTDNSKNIAVSQYVGSNRVFQLVSGSAGNVNTTLNTNGYTNGSGSYGWMLPDIGTLLLSVNALKASTANGGLNWGVTINAPSQSTAPSVNAQFFSLIKTASLNSQETITSDYIFVRARSSEFNYSENPSFISGSTGEVLYNSFINSPQTYITTVGLYNDTNELLAVAKLSRPLPKDFTKEALVRCKLDF